MKIWHFLWSLSIGYQKFGMHALTFSRAKIAMFSHCFQGSMIYFIFRKVTVEVFSNVEITNNMLIEILQNFCSVPLLFDKGWFFLLILNYQEKKGFTVLQNDWLSVAFYFDGRKWWLHAQDNVEFTNWVWQVCA